MIGKEISHYRILQKLGEGGMGVVYKANDLKLKRTIALKFLPPTFSFNEDAQKRFTHEAQSASSLDHPNICTIFENGETPDGRLFISMAYYEGETLKEKIKEGELKKEEIIDLIIQICEGLNKAHQNGIIHRDIKPSNLFITNDNIVKILDFGLSKSKDWSELTQLNTTMGTVAYMSPEQARGEKVDQRTDIWSLGVVIYEMLSGRQPFKADYDQAVIYSILNEEPDLNKIPKEFRHILKKAISKSIKDRYLNIEEIINDLLLLKNESKAKRYFLSIKPRRISLKTRIISVAALMVGLTAIIYFNTNKTVDDQVVVEQERKMIVVLPFENLGPPEDEYLALGIREEISNKLSSFANLGVISRSSASKYTNSKKTVKEIGKELGVDFILDGTLQWAKNKGETSSVRIIPQLISVSDDINIWSASYDRVIDDIFNIQNEIAQNVANKLGIKIIPGHFASIPAPTNNLDAYDYYLKALLFQSVASSNSDLLTCIRLFQKAIELDPDFALAHAQISIAYMAIYSFYIDRDLENLKKASEHLQKAAELNPDIAGIHLANAFYYEWIEENTPSALEEFKKTVEIDPSNAEAYFWIGQYSEETDSSLEYLLMACSLDPLVSRYPSVIGDLYNSIKDYKNADKYFNRAIGLSPNTSYLYLDLAENYIDWHGNTKLAWETINNNKINNDEYLEEGYNIFIYLKILDRSFDEVLKELRLANKEYANDWLAYIPNSQMIALVYRYIKKYDLSKIYFDSSRVQIEKLLLNNPDDIRLHRSLSISYAGLGEKAKSLNENKKAIELVPLYNERRRKKLEALDLAQIYTLTGDYNNALEQIDYMLSNQFRQHRFSVNLLKLDPIYDPLRNLPGYKKIIEKYSTEQKSKI